MARFNKKGTGTKTKNLAGGEAFKQSDKLEFASLLLTSFVQDQFYRSAKGQENRATELITGFSDKKFAAKAAIYARKRFGMRSITHIAAAEVGKAVKGATWTKNFFEMVVNRPDDITETISYYLGKYGFPLPKAMMKGFKKCLEGMSEYQLAKYKGEGKAVKMVDVVNLLHPKATPALTKLMKGELKSTETWETQLTQAGQKGESESEVLELKGAAWKSLLEANKLGYFALLRNLRNIAEQAPDVLDLALTKLVDAEAIKRSLVLPFRFYTAAKELSKTSGSRKIINAISQALDIAVQNCPELPGKTLVVLDESGSMTWGKCGSVTAIEMGSLFASVLYKRNDADFMLFQDRARFINPDPNSSVLGIMNSIEANAGGTNFHAIFAELGNKHYDQIIILSDMQGWIGYNAPTDSFNAYKRRSGADPKIYSFDLTGHGTMQFPERNVFCLAGFSEKIFDLMKLLDEDKNALVKEIERVEL